MSEIKVNTINPSSGTTVSLGTGTLILGNTGSNAGLMVSSATGEALPDSRISIYTTNGIVKTAQAYKANLGGMWGEYIGPISNHGLGLLSSNNTRLWIDATGNVGIGTITPSTRLHLGNMFISTPSPTGSEQTSHIRLYEVGEVRYGLGISTLALNLAANQSGGTIRLHTDSIERVRVDGNGNVGIGVTNPLDELHIVGVTGPQGFGVYGNDNLLYNGHFGATGLGVGISDGWQVSTFGFTVGSPRAQWNSISSGNRGANEYVVNCIDGGGIYQDVSVVPGAVYTLCAKTRVTSTGSAGDASISVLTVGTTTNATSIVNKQFTVNTFDTGNDVGKFIYCSETFTAPSANTPLTTIRVGVRSLGSTHHIDATDIGLYKGAVSREFTPITVRPNSKDVVIAGRLGIGKSSPVSQYSIDSSGMVKGSNVLATAANLTPISGQVFVGENSYNGMTRYSVYNSDAAGNNASAFYHANNNICNGLFGIYGNAHSTYPNTVSLEADSLAAGGLLLYCGGATAPIRVINASGEVMRITSVGRVGIGTTGPAVALDVNGEARSSTSTTSSSNAKTLTTKDYVDSLMWTSSSTATIPIGGIVMTGAQSGEGNGVDNGGGGTINTTSIGPGYIIYAITYAANSGNNKLGGRYWIGARTQAQISADTAGGYTGTPTVIYGTFVCRGVAERSGINLVPYLWQRIA